MRQLAMFVLCSGLFLTGCSTTQHLDSAAPQPGKAATPAKQGPANGRRLVNDHGLELIYKANLEVFVLADISDIYFSKNLYLRFCDGRWEATQRIGESWREAKHREVPTKLRKAVEQTRPAMRISQQTNNPAPDLLSLIR